MYLHRRTEHRGVSAVSARSDVTAPSEPAGRVATMFSSPAPRLRKKLITAMTLRRKKPLRRKTWLRSRGNTSYRRRVRDIAYMKRVKKLPCAVRWFSRQLFNQIVWNGFGQQGATCCEGRVEADHAGVRGLGQKADDRTCIPMCTRHHRERTDQRGSFGGWTAQMMREWCEVAIAATQEELRDG